MVAAAVEVGIARTGDGIAAGTWLGASARGSWAGRGWAQVQGAGRVSGRGLRWSSECERDLEGSREGRMGAGRAWWGGKGGPTCAARSG